MKTIRHASLSLKVGTSRVIEQSIFPSSSSSLMTFKLKGRLMFNRSAQVIIWRTYLQRHSLHPHLKSWYTKSGCDDCEILSDVTNRGRLYSFSLDLIFIP
ncbi:hypothetical protein PIB30_110929 [Stylosanthes scabra]|uniref:Uncharacterized protein n=1 Tax=Stylosanthes scabra TaxID=79078 RepID=A0ABU6T0H6_9FABA|nr:hypothetical protein [Stylosanthes scabra]